HPCAVAPSVCRCPTRGERPDAMNTGRDYVVLSDDWDGAPTSSIHLFRRLARTNRVFWLNTVGRMPQLNRTDVGKALRTAGRWVRSRPPEAPSSRTEDLRNVHITTPLMVPWFKPPVRRFNAWSLLRRYREMVDRFGVRDPVVVTTFPYAVDFLRAV